MLLAACSAPPPDASFESAASDAATGIAFQPPIGDEEIATGSFDDGVGLHVAVFDVDGKTGEAIGQPLGPLYATADGTIEVTNDPGVEEHYALSLDLQAIERSDGNVIRVEARLGNAPSDAPACNPATAKVDAGCVAFVDLAVWRNMGQARRQQAGTPGGTSTSDDVLDLPENRRLRIRMHIEEGAANTAPVVTIAAPAEGSEFTEGADVTFSGTAMDLEDGDVSASLEWTSSIDGVIGQGGVVTTSALSSGGHDVTATATDSQGRSASASVSVTILEGQDGHAASPTLWPAGDASNPARPVLLELGSDGHLYSAMTGNDGYIELAKRTTSGDVVWTKTDSSLLPRPVYDVAFDPQTNEIVVLAAHLDGRTAQYVVRKYGSDGSIAWTTPHPLRRDLAEGSRTYHLEGLTVTPSGEVVVAGAQTVCCTQQYRGTITIWLDGEGTELHRSYVTLSPVGTRDEPLDLGQWTLQRVTSDGASNVYLVGRRDHPYGDENDREHSVFVQKLDDSGTSLWYREHLRALGDPTMAARRTAINPTGDLVVAGFVRRHASSDDLAQALAFSVSPEGGLRWHDAWGSEYGLATFEDLEVGADGSAFIVGTILDDHPNIENVVEEDLIVRRYGPAGTLAWHTRLKEAWPVAERRRDHGMAIARGDDGLWFYDFAWSTSATSYMGRMSLDGYLR